MSPRTRDSLNGIISFTDDQVAPATSGAGQNYSDILAAGIGPGWDRRVSNLLTLAVGSTVVLHVNGATEVAILNTDTSAAGSIQITLDQNDGNWRNAFAWEVGPRDWIDFTVAQTLTVKRFFLVPTTGARRIRIRTSVALSNDVNFNLTFRAIPAVTIPWNRGQVAKAQSQSIVPASDFLGQALMAASEPVVIASDQSRIPVENLPYNVAAVNILQAQARFTTAQTSVNLVAGTGGQRIYVVHLQISVSGTTAGDISIYWGTGAFTAGTSPTLFDGTFAPSATVNYQFETAHPFPAGGSSAQADNLRITTSAAITCKVQVSYYKAA